jgi:hypothetical protein
MTFMILATMVLLSQPNRLFRTSESKGINFYPKGCYMPDRCKWVTDLAEINSHTIDLICNDISAKFDRDKLKNSSMVCQRIDQPYYYAMSIFFKQQKKIILDNSFDFYNIIYAIGAFLFYDAQIRFINIIGFSSDLALDLKNSYISFSFIDGEFKIYSKVNGSNRLIQTCQELRINSVEDKGFRFRINYILPQNTYPLLFHHDHRILSQSRSLIYVSLIYAFNSVYDVVNYLLFTIVHICFDLFLFNKVRITLNEKENKFKSDTKATREKKKKENEEIKRRVLTMVILCAFVNLIGKVPISIVSLNDVRLLINLNFEFFGADDNWAHEHFTAFYSMKSICYLSDGCLLFQDFGNFLYCISISLNLFFFYRFDIKFKNAYQLVFFSKSKKDDNNLKN